jgi:osmoprotectant transport system permease protein
VNLFLDAFAWLTDPANWEGPDGIGARLAFHLVFSLAVVAGSVLIALPVGILIGHTGRGREPAVVVSGALRALPTLGLLTLLALWLGLVIGAPYLALMVLAVPSVLAGAYAGIGGVSRATVDAARAMGMTELQIALRVELPLGLPTIIGGIRAAVLQVIATATLASYIGLGGLGTYIFLGLKTADYTIMLGASILIIGLALVLDGMFALVQRLGVPEGVRVRRTSASLRSRPSRPRATVG